MRTAEILLPKKSLRLGNKLKLQKTNWRDLFMWLNCKFLKLVLFSSTYSNQNMRPKYHLFESLAYIFKLPLKF